MINIPGNFLVCENAKVKKETQVSRLESNHDSQFFKSDIFILISGYS